MAKAQHQKGRGGINPNPNPILIAIGALFVIVFFSFPYMLMLISSLKSQADVRRIPPQYWPTEPLWSIHFWPFGKAQVLLLGYGGQGHEGTYLTDSLLLLHSERSRFPPHWKKGLFLLRSSARRQIRQQQPDEIRKLLQKSV